ncbi:MAG: hypothetical protein ACETWG_09180, partial [Candidatus Neomarinimicrobiota bacterium]
MSGVKPPAFVLLESRFKADIDRVASLTRESGSLLLYPLKTFSLASGLIKMLPWIDGFSTSSLFEAKLARELAGKKKTIHFTAPGIRREEATEIFQSIDRIYFNSQSQMMRLNDLLRDELKVGLRINPQISFIEDDRYNPSRQSSKLGTPLKEIAELLSNGLPPLIGRITGILIHNNTDSVDFLQLYQTIENLDQNLSKWLSSLEWINLGGGYLYNEATDLQPFYDAVNLLRNKHGLEVFIEPGAAIVRDAGYIVSSVLDIFKSDGKTIAI